MTTLAPWTEQWQHFTTRKRGAGNERGDRTPCRFEPANCPCRIFQLGEESLALGFCFPPSAMCAISIPHALVLLWSRVVWYGHVWYCH